MEEVCVSEIDKEFNEEETYEILGVPTYLSLMKKYPQAKEDILNLRRSKNKALYFLIGAGFFIGFLIGHFIAMYNKVF